MESKKEVNLNNYLEKKKISIKEFSIITGVSVPTIYRIISNPDWNTALDNIRKIYNGTLKKFGEGLDWYEYLNK